MINYLFTGVVGVLVIEVVVMRGVDLYLYVKGRLNEKTKH